MQCHLPSTEARQLAGSWRQDWTRDYAARSVWGDPRGRKWGEIFGLDKRKWPARAEGEKRLRSATRNP